MGNNLSGKYGVKHFYHAKQSAAYAVKTALKRAVQKIAETTDDIIEDKTADKLSKLSKMLRKNTLETVSSETEDIGLDAKIPKE